MAIRPRSVPTTTQWTAQATGLTAAPLPEPDPNAISTPTGRVASVNDEQARLAAARGLDPQQSALLTNKLTAAQVAFDAELQRSGSGQRAQDAMMATLGPIEPWMRDALAREREAYAGPLGAPAPGSNVIGSAVQDANGNLLPYGRPASWGEATNRIFDEAVQDPRYADSGEGVPLIQYLDPSGKAPGAQARGPSGVGLEGLTGQGANEYLGPAVTTALGAVAAGPAGAYLGYKLGKEVYGNPGDAAASYEAPTNPGAAAAGPPGVPGGGTGGVGTGVGGPGDADYKRLMEQAAGIKSEAPVVSTPGPTDVATFDPAIIAEIERANAGTVDASRIAPTTQTQIAEVGDVADAEAQRINAAQIDPAALAQAAQIRRDQESQMRERQLSILQQLQDAADGKAPSVAQLMLKRQIDENIAQQQGLAASARGNQVGLAAQRAATNIGNLNQKAALDQAILRATEIANARGQLGSAANDIRSSDIGIATSQAGLENTVNLANQGAINTRAGQQAQLTQDADKTNQAAALQTALANAKARNDRAALQAQLAQQAYNQNASAENLRALEQAKLEQAAAMKNLDTATQVSLANAGAYNTRAIQQAGLTQDANKTNTVATNTRNLADSQTAKDIALANQRADIDTRQLDINEAAGLRGTAMQKYGADSAAATARYNTDANKEIAKSGADATVKGGLIAAGASALPLVYDAYKTYSAGSGGGTGTVNTTGGSATQSNYGDGTITPSFITSDKRAKEEIRDAMPDIQAFLDAMTDTRAQAFKYRDEMRDGGGTRYGKMAQDIEKSKVGKSMVKEDEDGRKVIDNAAAISAMLASLAEVNGRVRKLEKRKGR